VFPKIKSQRDLAFSVYDGKALPSNYDMYAKPAARLSSIPLPCQMYASVGCSFVMNIQIAGKSKANWMQYINSTSQRIKNDYIKPLDDIVKSVAHYSGMSLIAIASIM
jgi:hypothetical protein